MSHDIITRVIGLNPATKKMQTRSSSSSASKDLVSLVPERQLQIVDPTSFRGKFVTGWTVVNRPRSSSPSTNGSVDTGKYFIEPASGREFPSIESVQRHLVGEVDDRRLTRAGHFSKEKRTYEGSRTKQGHRRLEYASKGFRLPKGWKVQEFPRRNSYHIDKVYVEHETGKRFRSLVSVERYLKESRNGTEDEQLMVLEYPHRHSKDFSLPDGWIIEEKPRRNSSQIDKSYVEPVTGKKFRSLAAVERYLNGAADSFQSMVHSQRLSLLASLNITGFQTELIDPTPPQKVKWVFTGPGGNMFSAHVSGSDISCSVKQTWSEAFVSLIQGRS